jgi:hypothetical protein
MNRKQGRSMLARMSSAVFDHEKDFGAALLALR